MLRDSMGSCWVPFPLQAAQSCCLEPCVFRQVLQARGRSPEPKNLKEEVGGQDRWKLLSRKCKDIRARDSLSPESAGPGDTEGPWTWAHAQPRHPWALPLCGRVWRGKVLWFLLPLFHPSPNMAHLLRSLSLSYAVPSSWSVLSLLCQQHSPRRLRACSLRSPAPSLSPLLPPPCLLSLQGLDAHDSDSGF